MAAATRSLADQLATIAAQLDAILASLRDDVEEIKARVIGEGCNSEESNINLKNTVAEEPQGSEHDPLQQLGSGSGGGITDRNNVTGDGIEGADEMDDGMGTDKTDKSDGTRIEAWGTAENLTANDNHDRKGRGEIGALVERLVLLPRSLSLVVREELVRFKNKGCKLNYHDCTVVLQRVSPPFLFMTTTISRQLSVLRKTLQRPRTMVVYFIIVWDPGKEILGGPTWKKPTEGECVHTKELLGGPCTCGSVLNGNKLRDYNNPLQKTLQILNGWRSKKMTKPLGMITTYSRTSFLIFDLRSSRLSGQDVLIQTRFLYGLLSKMEHQLLML